MAPVSFGKRIPVRREQTGDPAQERAQSARDEIAARLNAVPWLDGRLVDGSFSEGTQRGDGSGPGVVVGTSDTLIEHGLGRVPRGFLVLSCEDNAGSIVRSLPANQPTDQSRTFALVASAAVRVKLWVW